MHAKIKKYFLTVTLYKRESVIEHTFAYSYIVTLK